MSSKSVGLGVLLAATIALLVAWSLVVPIFEAPDEPAHWTYARYLHDYHRLPDTSVLAQANYPPLYYLLIAPLAVPSDLPSRAGADTGATGLSIMQFPPRFYRNADGDLLRYWPIRLARFGSVAMSLLTVWWCYLAGWEATGRRETGILAGGFVAFLPQFTFRGMNVADDVLVTALAALVTYLLIRLLCRGFTWAVGIGAALVVAAAILSKISALFLFGPLALALLVAPGVPWRARPRRLLVLGASAALLAPWMLRNLALYGDPLAAGAVNAAIADRVVRHELLSRYIVVELPLHTAKSFIGNFGWQSLGLPWWLYGIYCGGLLLAALGLLHLLRRDPAARPLALFLLLIPALNLIVLLYLNLNYVAWQGRYLFPALPALGLLLALGLESLPRWSGRFVLPVVAGLGLLNALILGFIITPAYWPAP